MVGLDEKDAETGGTLFNPNYRIRLVNHPKYVQVNVSTLIDKGYSGSIDLEDQASLNDLLFRKGERLFVVSSVIQRKHEGDIECPYSFLEESSFRSGFPKAYETLKELVAKYPAISDSRPFPILIREKEEPVPEDDIPF